MPETPTPLTLEEKRDVLRYIQEWDDDITLWLAGPWPTDDPMRAAELLAEDPTLVRYG